MKWVIKNPAPEGERQHKWGDFHFGRCLAKYLERMGDSVETAYHPNWESNGACDVILVLRGKYPYDATPQGGALRVLWNISHPESVTLEEMSEYDIVAVASHSYASWLGGRLSGGAEVLRQCTDAEIFWENKEVRSRDREGFVFVGNTRETLRPVVLWAAESGLPLDVWGRGWQKWPAIASRVTGDYLANEELGKLYARSRATFNDHWVDMKNYGFINNRVFDALACGLPVISDGHDELSSLFGEDVLLYENQEEFAHCLERLLLRYPEMQERASAAGARVREEFTFERRASELRSLVNAKLS